MVSDDFISSQRSVKSAVSFTVFLFFGLCGGACSGGTVLTGVGGEFVLLKMSCEKMSETDMTACIAVLYVVTCMSYIASLPS